MEIGSVSSSVAKNSFQQQTGTTRQETKILDVESTRQGNDDTRAREARSTPKPAQTQQDERSRNPDRPEPPEVPKPVVNAQGQKTGTIINTTA